MNWWAVGVMAIIGWQAYKYIKHIRKNLVKCDQEIPNNYLEKYHDLLHIDSDKVE